MRAADGGRRSFRQPDVADLALRHQFGHRTHHLFDRHCGVDAVLVVEVDVIDSQPAQRSFHRDSNIRRRAVGLERRTGGMRNQSELRRQHHLIATARDGLTHQFLIGVRAVDFGGVDQADAQIERAMDGLDGPSGIRTAFRGQRLIARRHRHGAEADP